MSYMSRRRIFLFYCYCALWVGFAALVAYKAAS